MVPRAGREMSPRVLQVGPLYRYNMASSLPSQGFTRVSWAVGNAPSQMNLYSETCWEASAKHRFWKPAFRLGKLSYLVLTWCFCSFPKFSRIVRAKASSPCWFYLFLVTRFPSCVSRDCSVPGLQTLILSNVFGFSPFPLLKYFAPFYSILLPFTYAHAAYSVYIL